MNVKNKIPQIPLPQKAIIFCSIIIAFLLFYPKITLSQDLNQKISFTLRNVALSEVIDKISDITNLSFSYSPQLIQLDKKISVRVKNKNVKDVLDAVFKGSGIDYIIIENQVVLKPMKKEDVQNNRINQDVKKNYTISGYLKDKKTGETCIPKCCRIGHW